MLATGGALLVAAALLVVARVSPWIARELADFSYEADVARLEQRLTSQRSIEEVQAWLVQRGDHRQSPDTEIDRALWPACIRALPAARVHEAENGGVWLHLLGGFRLSVYPRGKRPPKPLHKPSWSHTGYVGAFGPDAYIEMDER